MQNIFLGRAKILEGSETITVEIPTHKDWFAVIFLLVWLCGWLFGLVTVATSLITGYSSSVFQINIFTVFWLIGWFIGGGFFAYIWVRMVFGFEISEFSKTSVSIGKKILWFEQGQSFDASNIQRLRGLPVPEPTWFDQRHLWSGGAASIGFDYGSRTIRFGRGIDEAEATQLLERVISTFPQYQTVALTPSPWNQAFRNRV